MALMMQGTMTVVKPVSVTCSLLVDGSVKMTFAGAPGAGKTLLRRQAADLFTARGGRVISSGDDQDDRPAVLTDTLVVQPPEGMGIKCAFDTVKRAATAATQMVA